MQVVRAGLHRLLQGVDGELHLTAVCSALAAHKTHAWFLYALHQIQ